MQDNIKDLHSALINDGHYSENDLGNEQEFRKYISKPENAKAFHQAIMSDGYYNESELGNEDEFIKYVGTAGTAANATGTVAGTDGEASGTFANGTKVVATDETGGIEQNTDAIQPHDPNAKPIVGAPEEPGMFSKMGDAVKRADQAFVDYISQAQKRRAEQEAMVAQRNAPAKLNENILSDEEERRMLENAAATGQLNPTRSERQAAIPSVLMQKGENTTGKTPEERFETPVSKYAKESVFKMRGDEAARKRMEEQPFYTTSEYVDWLGTHPEGNKDQFEEELLRTGMRRTRMDVEDEAAQKFVDDTTVGEQLASIVTQTVDNAWRMRGVVGLSPQALSAEIGKQIQATPMTVAFMSKIYDEAQKLDIPFTDFLQKAKGAIIRSAQQKAMSQLEAKMMPKDDIEYMFEGIGESTVARFVRGMMFNPEYISMQERANQTYGAGVQQRWEDTVAENVGNETLRKVLTTTNPTELGRIGFEFAPEFLPMGFVGKVTGGVAKAVMEAKVARLVTLGMEPAAAARVVTLAAEGASTTSKMAQAATIGGANFAGYNVLSELARQFETEDYDAKKLAKEGLKGLIIGGAIGSIGKGINVATQSSSAATRLAGMAGAFAAEDAVFTGAEEAEKWAEGRTDEIDLVEDFTRGALTLGVMKMSSPGGLKESVAKVRRALNGEADPGAMLNEVEREQFKNSLSCKGLVAALNKATALSGPEFGEINKGTEVGMHGGGSYGIAGPMADEMRAEIAEAYRSVILDPTLDYSLKVKIGLAFEGSLPANVPRPTSFTTDDDNMTVKTRDEHGFVIKTIKAKNKKEYETAKDRAVRSVIFSDALREGNLMGFEIIEQMVDGKQMDPKVIVKAIRAYIDGNATKEQNEIAGNFYERYMEVLRAMRTSEAGEAVDLMLEEKPIDVKAGTADAGAAGAGAQMKTEADASGTVAKPAAEQQGTVAGSDGGAAGSDGGAAGADGSAAVSGSTAPNLAAGAGVDGAGAQGGTGTGGQRTRGMMQRQRGEKIVADGDAMGAADLHTELVTAEARLGRVFADGSQNKAVADNAKKMADEGRADQAYEYLLGEQGNMSETQRSAIEAYIDAQAAVTGMEQSVSEGIEAQVRSTEQRMMQMTNNQSGLLQSVMVTPMGAQKEPVKAYIKSGSLTNEYGPGSVQVVYVTVDEMGNEIPQQTVQIAKSRIVEGSASQPMSVDDYVDAYREQLTASINAQWAQNREGLSYKIGDKVYLTNGHDGVMEVVVDGVTADGEVVYHLAGDATQTDSDSVEDFNKDVMMARDRLVGLQLTAEDSARIEEQKRQKMAAREEKRASEIVGYQTGGLRKEDGGNIDLTHKGTRSQTAADYLVETEGGNEKAVAWIEAQKEQLATRINELLSQREDEAQWIGAYGGQDNPEEASHQTALEGIDNALTESSRQYQKLNEIKFYAMNDAMKKALAKTRGDEILDLQNSAKARYKAPKETYKKGLPTDREGEVRLGVMEPQAAEKYLLDNCKTMMDADEALRQQFNRIDEEGRRLRSLVDNHRRRLKAYREGREDYDANELKGIVDAEYRLQQEIQSLLAERTGVNNLDKKLEKIYAERNALDYQDDPTKLRVERIQRRKTAAAKLEQARREYANYPEAMVVLDAGLEPQTIDEYVSQVGSEVLNWEGRDVGEHHVRGLQEEIGRNMVRTHGVGKYRVVGDTRAFDYVLAPKGEGVGIDELAHKMAEDTQWEPDEIKEALINMLMSATKPDDIRNYIINNRLEEAETAARQQDDAEEAAAEEAAWRARNGMGEGGTAAPGAAAQNGAGAQDGAGDAFAEASGAEGLYEGYDFMLSDNAEKENEHNERAKKEGGLISNAGSKGVDAGLSRLLDRAGRQIGRTIRIQSADEMWDELSEAQKRSFGSKKKLEKRGSAYNDEKNKQIVVNGAWLQSWASPEEALRMVVGHELTHAIKTLNSAEAWGNFVGYVKNAMGENAFNSLLEEVRRKYGAMPGYTGADKERKLEEEVCAYWIGDNKFNSDADIQKLVDAVDADGVDMSAFMDTIRRILDMLNDLEEMAKEMKDAGLIDEYESGGLVDYKNKALGAWDEMYKRAAEKVEENRRRSVGNADEGVDFMLVTDPNEIKAFDDAPRRTQYRSMQLIDGKLYPPMATVVGKGKEKKRQDGLTIGDLFKADENPHLAKPVIDKATGEQKVNPKTGRLQYSFSLDKGGKDDFGEELTPVDAAYNPYVHTSNSPINDQFATAYKRSNLVTVEGEISEDDINSGYWAEKAHDSVGEKDWKLGVTSTALEKAGKVARKVTLSQYFRPTRIVPTEEVAKYYAEQLKGTDITIPFNTVGPELREALVKLGVTISEPEKSNAGRASLPAYEAWKAASVKAPSGKAYEITKIDSPISGSTASDALGNSTFVTGAKLLKDVEKTKEKGKKLLGNDEKVANQQKNAENQPKTAEIQWALDTKGMTAGERKTTKTLADQNRGAEDALKQFEERMTEKYGEDFRAEMQDEWDDYFALVDRAKVAKRAEESWVAAHSEDPVREAAIERFKTTARFAKGAYILPDGRMLDFSDGTDRRVTDHRNIKQIYDENPQPEGVDPESLSVGMVDFMRRGNIRIKPEANGFELCGVPTSGQIETLKRFIGGYCDGDVDVDFGDGWDVMHSASYSGARPARVISDIKRYFEEGVKPAGDEIQWALDVREHDPWLSNAAEGLNKIKQEKATGEQWVKMLQKNGGLKAEEDKWIGLSEWLTGSDGVETPANGGKVRTFTKAQVRQFIEGNAVKIEDVEYAEGASEDDLYEAISPYQDEFTEIYENSLDNNDSEDAYNIAWDEMCDKYPDFNMTFEYLPQAPDYLSLHRENGKLRHEALKMLGMDDSKPIDSTRLEYTTEGLTNKREIAMVVPGVEPYRPDGNDLHFEDAGEGRAVAWVRFGDAENVVTETSTDEGALQALSNAKKAFDDYHKKLEEKYGTTELLELASKMSREDNAEWNRLDEEVTKADEAVNKTKRNKVLVMDEVQSKRHQDGREKGYRTNDDTNAYHDFQNELIAKYGGNFFAKMSDEEYAKYKELEHKQSVDTVPDAPFRKNWHEVGMKRMLRYAAENGYDKLAWTTGKQQAERYDLGDSVRSIIAGYTADGERVCILHTNPITTLHYDDAGKITDASNYEDTLVGSTLSDILGKELGQKILAIKEGEREVFEGNDLMLGGEGMKGFYDQMLVKFMDKYCKKWGVKVQDVELDLPNSADRVMHSVDITPEMKDDVLDGQLMWALAGVKGAINIDKTSREDLKGEQSDVRTDNIFNLQRAIYLEETGYDAETVKYATGWERGVDGLWRLETNDLDIRFEPEGDEHTIMELAEGGDLKLGDIIKGDNGLFEAYPELADVIVDGNVYGYNRGRYIPTTNVLSLNVDDLSNAYKSLAHVEKSLSRFDAADAEERKMILELADARNETSYKKILESRKGNYENDLEFAKTQLGVVLAHEVQHYIQDVEGFAQGGNPQMDAPEKLINERMKERKAELDELNARYEEAVRKTSEAEDVYREALRKHGHYAYVQDENGDWKYNAEKASSPEGKALEAEYKRLYDVYDKLYDTELALLRELDAVKDDMRPLGMDGYRRLAGEVEARTVGRRSQLNDRERRESVARSMGNMDIPEALQIVVRGEKHEANSAGEPLNTKKTEAPGAAVQNRGTVAKPAAKQQGTVAGTDGETAAPGAAAQNRGTVTAEMLDWMLGERRMNAGTTTQANKESWERAKGAYPEKVIVMEDGAGRFVTFRDDARTIGEAIGKKPEDGVLRLNYGEYMTAQTKLGDVVDDAHWSGFESFDDAEGSVWADGKVRGRDAKEFVRTWPEYKRLRGRISEAVKQGDKGVLEAACDDYREALNEMLDNSREDINVLKGAHKVLVEQLSEVNDVQAGVASGFAVDSAAPGAAARNKAAGTKADASGTVARGVKSQKEWQKMAPTDYELWESADMGERDSIGEYYDGDWQALCHAVKRGETGAIEEAARRMAVIFNTYPDEENRSTKKNDSGHPQQLLVLVPVPGHTGKATYTLRLVKELSKLTGIPYADILEAEPHKGGYAAKLDGEDAEIVIRVKEGTKAPEAGVNYAARIPVLIDNVTASGKTLNACAEALDSDARKALGLDDGNLHTLVLAEDNSISLPIGEKTVSLQAQEASRVRWQTRELPEYKPEQPWKDVKKVAVHTSNMRKRLPQMYYAAKHGDVKAAHELVSEVMKPHVIVSLAVEHPGAMVVYPHYESADGANAIPAAYAEMFEGYGLTVDTDIVQKNRVYRTDATRYDRLMNRARFAGDVIPGQEYILVDDHITSGATLRDMKDYIESEGGVVVAWSALEGSAGSTNVELTEENKNKLKELGVTDEQVRKLGISRSIDNLTNAEARELATLAKRGRDFRSKEQKAERARAVARTEAQGRRRRADQRAAEAESRRLREAAEAEKRYEDLRRERERFVRLFGEMPAETPLGTREGTEADASGTFANGTKVVAKPAAKQQGTVAGTDGETAAPGAAAQNRGTVAAAEWESMIKAARDAVNANPTDGQKEAGNYKKGHLRLDGFNISLENAKGSTRSGKDADGKAWSVTMNYDYGDIRGRVGVDGDNIDVYLSDKPYEGNVYVVDQVDPKTGVFDEHKVMYGFNSLEEAKEAYLSNYEDGWKGLGGITEVGKAEFKEWLQSSKRKVKPFAEYKRFSSATAEHQGGGTAAPGAAARNRGDKPRVFEVEVTDEDKVEMRIIEEEMEEILDEQASNVIEYFKTRDIEEQFGRYPGDKMSLRDRGIVLTPYQRKLFRQILDEHYEWERRNIVVRNRSGKVVSSPIAAPTTPWNRWGWWPEELPKEADYEENPWDADAKKVDFGSRERQATTEKPLHMLENETVEEAEARWKRERARERVKARLEGTPMSDGEAAQNGAGVDGDSAGRGAKVDKYGQLSLWDDEGRDASGRVSEDVLWALGVDPTRPRKKRGESEFEYKKRVKAWQKMQEYRSSLPPAPDKEAIDQRWTEQFENDHAAWAQRHGLDNLMDEEPDRPDYNSVDEYIEALKTWEKQETASVDVNDPEPQALDYMKKAQEEYREAYTKWEEESNIHGTDPGTYGAQAALMSQFSPAAQKRAIDEKWHEQYKRDLAAWEERHGLEWWMTARPDRKNYGSVDEYAEALKAWEKQVEAQNDTQDPKPKETDYMVKAREEYNNALTQFKKDNNVKEEGEGTLDFSTVFTGEGAQPRTVVGTNVETGEQVEMPADEVLAERIVEDEEIMKETGANIGFANTPAGARRAVKIAVIERRKTLESSGAEDAIFLHELKTDMKKVAKKLGMKGEELDKMLPFIIEAPTRLAEIVRDTYFDMSKRDLDFYTVKYLLPKIFSNEATDEALINDLRDVMRQAVEAGKDEGLTTAMKHYAYYNDERVKPILDKVAKWYQEFYVLLDNKGLRRDAGKVKDYVNHIWDKERSDTKAYDTYVRTTSSNMRMREIETYAKGIEAGLVPKREKLSEIMAHYSRENNEAIANKELLNYLTGLQVALYNSDGELVDSLDLLSNEDPGLNKNRYMRYEVPGVGGVWVLKDVQKRFATIFGQEWNLDANEGENKLWRSYDRVADTMKKIQLSLSFFHLGALTEVATVQKNPFMAMADLFKYTFWDSLRAGTTPALAHPEDFKDAAAHLVKLGASDDYAAAEVQALTGKLRELAQEVYDHQKAVGAVPLAASALLDWINKGMDKLLWEYVHDGLKVAIFRGYAKNIRAKAAKEGWSNRKLDMMLDEAGQYINDAFGGQYWEVIGVTPATLRTLRRALLSPDWFISTARHALAATGFGSLYSPEDFIAYATMRGKWDKEYKEEYEEAMRAEGDEGIGNEGRKFRAKKSLLCYGLLVPLFYGGMMNVINAAFRYADEQREKEKADEIRKTNPDYLSPYEIMYPDGMKWYDYTMWGNSVGNRTLLFTGRYKDGTERYARWGKQFREMPEFFTGRYGVEVPGPFLERMLGKANPLVGTALDLLRYFGAGLLNKTPEQQDLEQEYGKHLGALAMVAKKFLPFSVPTDESKEFYWLDLVMPSKKGFSDWRAVDAYEHFILAGDLDGVGAVTNACIMNGIDAEQKLQAAIKHIEATQRKERTSGIEDIESAMKAFDASGNVKDRRALKRKIAAFMTRENYKLFKAVDAQQRVADYLNGSDEAGTGVTRKQSEQYVLLMTAEDARDEIIITKAYGAANDVKKKAKVMAQNGNTSFTQQHAKEIGTAKVISSYRSAMNKLKKNLGKGKDEAVMADIRAKRKELIEKIDRLGE